MMNNNNDSAIVLISDDIHGNETNDEARLDSPPPGTIAPQNRHATVNTASKSDDGGLFIPESVRFECNIHVIVVIVRMFT
jgi:hypothetical protein